MRDAGRRLYADARLHYGLVALAFGAGLWLRLANLANPGTNDYLFWHAWADSALKSGVVDIYGTTPKYKGYAYPVNYPPLSIYALAALGHWQNFLGGRGIAQGAASLEGWMRGISYCADAAITALLAWFVRHRFGRDLRLALLVGALYWLNPAVLEDTAIAGYTDCWFAACVVGALVLCVCNRPHWGIVLFVVAILLKPQPLFFAPALAVWLWRAYGLKRLMSVAGVGLVAALVLTAPYIAAGRFLAVIGAATSDVGSDFWVSARQANIWWLWLWLTEAGSADKLTTTLTHLSLLPFSGQTAWGPLTVRGWSLIGVALFGAAVMWRVATWPRIRAIAPATLFFGCALCLFGYSQIAVQVHENHLFGALPLLLALVTIGGRRLWLLCGGLSVTVFLNIFMFEGVGGRDVPISRFLPGFDLTLAVAVAQIALFALACLIFFRAKLPDGA